MVMVSYDLEARATYAKVSQEPIMRTVHVSDLVMVDVDAIGAPVGVEFVVPPTRVTRAMVERAVEQFPGLKELLDLESWLLVRS